MLRNVRVSLLVAVLACSLLPADGARAAHPSFGGAPDGGPKLDPVPSSTIHGRFRTWEGESAGIPGKVFYDDREAIVIDHPFDDRGADTDGGDGVSDNPTERYTMLNGANAATSSAGDAVYPPDPDLAGNAADIVEVRVAADGDDWYVVVVLNTLIDASKTAVEIAMDDFRVLANGDHVVPLSSVPAGSVTVHADEDQNIFEFRIARAAADPQGIERVFVGAGLATDVTIAIIGAPLRHFDLAYVPDETMDTYWRERVQSQRLASQDRRRTAMPVDFDALLCEPCPPRLERPAGGLSTRVFRSGQQLGEGVTPQSRYKQNEASAYKLYRSRYQTYAIYEPPTPAHHPRPLVLLLHFLGGNHMSYPLAAFGKGLAADVGSFADVRTWADELGVIVAMPLARGEAGWYEAEAEKDVFEVWRDVASHYDIDRERVYLTGMSMGGYGTWRLGLLYPDQFARAIVWSGPVQPYTISAYPTPVMYPQQSPPACDRDEPGCGSTLIDLFGNARSLPYTVIHGGLDELVPSSGPVAWMAEYDAHQSTHNFVLYPTRRHETSFPGTTGDHVRQALRGLPARDRSPVNVVYNVVRDFQQPDEGLTYDGAYWIEGLRLVDGAEDGRIRAQRATTRLSNSGSGGGVGLPLGPWVETMRAYEPREPLDNAVALHMAGIDAATVDTVEARWDLAREVRVRVTTDHAADVTLSGPFPSEVSVEGMSFTRDGSDIVLHAPAGSTLAVITPA